MNWRKTLLFLVIAGVAVGAWAAEPLVPTKLTPLKFDVSPPLRDMEPAKAVEAPVAPENPSVPKGQALGPVGDPVVQTWGGKENMPAPIVNFEAIKNDFGVYPPDTQGDVGPNHYIQWVNLGFAIYNKSGVKVYPPAAAWAAGNTLWAGFGGDCQTRNDGDPITLYDPLADRWFMSQFTAGTAPYEQCIAVSVTNDPTGSWYRWAYAIPGNDFPDYPKFGVWPDGYYMTANLFLNLSSWHGAGVAALNRTKMLAGDPTAEMLYLSLYGVNPNFGSILPSDMDGPPPPAGTPNYFLEWDEAGWIPGDTVDTMRLWEFHVDWATPGNSTFGLAGLPNQTLTPANADMLSCVTAGSRACIPQPGTTVKLDSIGDRLMYRLQFRQFADRKSLVTSHTVNAGGDRAGVRWYELRNTGATWSINQQGTYAPADTESRWMGSAAMDAVGNMSIGYSVSSSTVYPSIRYAGRLAGDPAGEMPQAEATIITGSGSQTGTAYRWGDYSMMAVDPTDDCTFWYTQEYIQTTGTATWQTRVASYKFPSCISGPSGTLTGMVTNSGTGEPLAGASVTAGVYSTATNASGVYTILMAPGTYDVTASKFGYTPETATGVVIAEGETTTQDFALVASETSAIDGYVTDQGHGWPLWAKVEVSLAPPAPSAPVAPMYTVYTDPFTGYYDLGEVVGGQDYVFTVTPMYPGYEVMNRPVTAEPGVDQTQNFVVPPNGTCTAAGYVKQYGAAVYTENWDSVTWPALPTGWAVVRTGGTTTTTTWATRNNTRYPSGRGVHSPPNLVFFNSYSVTTGNSARLYRNTTGVDLSAVPFPTVRFWMYHDSGYTSNADRVQVQVSTDAGATWQNVGAPVNRFISTTVNEWRQHEVVLEGITGPRTDVRIGFNGISAYGNDIHLDEFEILSAPCVPIGGGMMAGFTTDANTAAAMNGVRVAHDLGLYSDSMATPGDPNLADGFYYLFAPIPGLQPDGPATRTFTATKSGYIPEEVEFTVVPNTTSRLDFEMDAGMLSMSPATLYSRLYVGETEVQGLSMDNTGGAPADFKIYAVETAPWVPSLPQDPIVVTVPPERANDMTTRLLPEDPKGPELAPYAAGDVISSFPTTLTAPWGVGVDQFNNMVWAANILQGGGDDKNHEFTFTGTKTGDTILVQFGGSWPGDMAFDPLNNKMWQVNVGGDNCIYEWDVATLTKTGNKICWGATTSERGLAYDMVSDTFFVGGWNTDAVTRFNRAGQVLQTKALAGSAISGLAVNPSTGHVFVMQNSPTDALLVLDANDNLNQIGTFTVAGFGNYAGAGLEFDCNGHLWATNQLDKKLYEIDSGETGTCPFLGNLPWFELDPLEGTVGGNASFPIDATFIADGATHYGLWQANVSVIHNTPYAVTGAHACLVKAFDDMAEGAFADAYVHGLAGARISQGCGGGNFCPDVNITRGVMARWLINSMYGPDYAPAPCTGIFSDVPCESTPNADHIEALYNSGVTGGCFYDPGTGERRYCPSDPVLRSQMAVFLLKAKDGSDYTPPPCIGVFGDVACPGGFAVDWIEELSNRGITAGCGGGNFCPNNSTLRSQMSVFVVKNWEIPICVPPPTN